MDGTRNVIDENSDPIFQINYTITAQDYRKSLENYYKIKEVLKEQKSEENKDNSKKAKFLPTFNCLIIIVFLVSAVRVFAADFEIRALENLIIYSVVALWIFSLNKMAAHRRKKYFDRITKARVEAGELERPEKFMIYLNRAEHVSTVFHSIYGMELLDKAVECSDGVFIIYRVEGKHTFIPTRFFNAELLETLKAVVAGGESAPQYCCIEKMRLPEAAERGRDFDDTFDRTSDPLYTIGIELTQNLRNIIPSKNNQKLAVKAIIFFAMAVLCFYFNPKYWLTAAILHALGAILLLKALILIFGIIRYLRRFKKAPPVHVEYKFLTDGFDVIFQTGCTRHSYDKIKKVKRYGDVLFVFLSDNTYLCIPKYAMEDEARFVKFGNFIKLLAESE